MDLALHRSECKRLARTLGGCVVLLLLAAFASLARAEPATGSAPAPAAVEAGAARPAVAPAPRRELVMDSARLAFAATEGGGSRLAEASLGADDLRVILDINRTRGTWQSYLLYTEWGLPDRLFHPGFTITLPVRVPPAPSPPEPVAVDAVPVKVNAAGGASTGATKPPEGRR